MSVLTRPILEINLDNLEKNYRFLQTLAQGAEAAAVVKDDAYGLGAETVAERLYENAGCRTFFVAHGIEGEKIRPHVPNAKIYVLQGIGEDSLTSFERANLIPVIAGREQLAFWKEHKIKGIKPAIQIETGLNRLGFRENELTEMSPDDRDLFSLVLSHLACADEQGHFMNEYQLQNFNRLRKDSFPDCRPACPPPTALFSVRITGLTLSVWAPPCTASIPRPTGKTKCCRWFG